MTPEEPPTGPEVTNVRPADVAPGRVTPGHAPKPMARLLGLLPVVVFFVVILLALDALEDIYDAVKSGGAADAIDLPVQAWMVAHRQGWLDSLATGYTHLGGKVGMPIIATTAVIALAWWWRTRTPVVLMAVSAAGSLLLTTQGKDLTGRARPPFAQAVPPLERSPSFPSGHTLNTVAVATVMGYLVLLYVTSRLGRVLTIAGLVTFCVLMAGSRVYLGHHWMTDVAAGAVSGLAWALTACLGHWLYVRLRTKDRAATVREVAQQHRREVAEARSGGGGSGQGGRRGDLRALRRERT